MDTNIINKSPLKPMTLAELLPCLRGILPKNSMQSLTTIKHSRPNIAPTRTAERVLRPMNITEMRAALQALTVKPPRTLAQPATSRNRNWNSSTKLEHKTKSCTADGKMKESTVRKVLDFHPKAPTASRTTMIATETPKFPKPEYRPKKTLHSVQAKSIRISGICNIPETPGTNKVVKNRMTIANKENNSRFVSTHKKMDETPKSIIRKKNVPISAATPLSNLSFKSNSDASFLQKEKEMEDIENKIKAISEEATLERIVEVSPPASTPFKDYRSIHEYFNKTSDIDGSTLYNDNTIMCFENEPQTKTIKRDESVIVSLCDLLNKATVSEKESEHTNSELEDLLVVEKQTADNLRMIDSAILTLNNIKQSQLKSLENVRKLITQKESECKRETIDKQTQKHSSLMTKNDENMQFKVEIVTPEKNHMLAVSRPSVIKTKSPSYKLPKKNSCLRKKVFCKSMPNVSEQSQTPDKDSEDKAFNMYMEMKEKMNFLNTPVIKHHHGVPNTPAMTSQNLQMQLDKLFNCS